MDNTTEIVGFCAMCLSAMKNVPQFKKICDDDNVSSFSKEAILLGIFATLLAAFAVSRYALLRIIRYYLRLQTP